MRIFRLTNSKYKDDLSGYGSYLFGGRWNSKQVYALYATEHISLAVLEIVVNYDRVASPLKPSFHLLELELPSEEDSIAVIQGKNLKKDWQKDIGYTQFIGDQFLNQGSHFIMKMPSAVIPEEYNFLLNPAHPEFKLLKMIAQRKYGFDQRLFG